MRKTWITGNTFPHKDTIKAAGAKWDPDAKAWWTEVGKLGAEMQAKLGALGLIIRDGEVPPAAPKTGSAAPKATKPEAPRVAGWDRNQFPGRCIDCGVGVAARAGYLVSADAWDPAVLKPICQRCFAAMTTARK